MLILFDQATPVPIRPFLKGHTVKTATQQGWDRLKNRELLRVAEEAGFDLLLTTDKNIAYQQNLKTRKIAILVVSNPQWPAVRPHVGRIMAAVEAAKPGNYDTGRIMASPVMASPRLRGDKLRETSLAD